MSTFVFRSLYYNTMQNYFNVSLHRSSSCISRQLCARGFYCSSTNTQKQHKLLCLRKIRLFNCKLRVLEVKTASIAHLITNYMMKNNVVLMMTVNKVHNQIFPETPCHMLHVLDISEENAAQNFKITEKWTLHQPRKPQHTITTNFDWKVLKPVNCKTFCWNLEV